MDLQNKMLLYKLVKLFEHYNDISTKQYPEYKNYFMNKQNIDWAEDIFPFFPRNIQNIVNKFTNLIRYCIFPNI